MENIKNQERGWLQAELRAAAREVDNWSAGMKRERAPLVSDSSGLRSRGDSSANASTNGRIGGSGDHRKVL